MSAEDIAAAFTLLSGEAVVAVARLEGNSSVASWRVETARATYAVRLYPEVEAELKAEVKGRLEPSFAHAQANLLRWLARQAFPVPAVEILGCYREQPLFAVSWVAGELLAGALQRDPEQAERLGAAFGALHAKLHALPLEGLEGIAQLEPPAAQLSLLHLDFHPLNALVEGGRFSGVIDWDNARLGDARADVARTLSILSVNPDLRTLPKEAGKTLRVLRRAYLRGYVAAAGAEALTGLEPFLAWAGDYMLADLARRYDTHALSAVRRWALWWRRRA